MSAQALVVEMYRAIERAEGRGSVDRARKAARAAGAESFSNSDATRWLAPFVKAADGSRDGKRTGFGRANKHETDGKRTENGRPDGLARGKGIPVEDLETTGPTVPTSLPIAGDVPDLFGQAVVNRLRGEKSYPRMMMVGVIPIEEINAERPGVLN